MKNKIKAFSLSETIIILTVLAVAIAASIPIMTKKMVNVSDAGSTITGASHGRYEIFSKEIITIEVPNEDGKYEKTTKPPKDSNKIFGGGKDSDIVVFRRLYDEEYIKVTNTVPALSKNGKYKSTLYEQIKDVTPIRNSDGEITFVEYKKLGVTKKVPVGGNIIVENANLVYKKGCLDTSDGVSEFTQNGEKRQDKSTCNATGSGADELPSDVARIIEGNFAKRCYKKTHHDLEGVTCDKLDNDANDLWLVRVKSEADLNPNFELKDETIPWERIYSGPEPIVDRPIPKDPDTGEYIGTFDPGEKAINVVVHAVGGGGAGGGLGDPGSAISPKGKDKDSSEMQKLAEELAKRFNEANFGADKSKYMPTSDIVDFETSRPIYNDNNPGVENTDTKYITINTHNGTITGKINIKYGYKQIFPHQLLKYTKTLGSQTQKSQIYDMPIWGTWWTIYTSGFKVASVGCGGAGGAATSYSVTESEHWEEKKKIFCTDKAKGLACNSQPCPCDHCTGCTGADGKPDWCCGIHGTHDTPCVGEADCLYACSAPYMLTPQFTITGSCSSPARIQQCPGNPANSVESSYTHYFPGGKGGAKPDCAVACKAAKNVVDLFLYCEPGGKSGEENATGTLGGNITVQNGQKGTSCQMFADEVFATSIGGDGGIVCAPAGSSGDEKYSVTVDSDEVAQDGGGMGYMSWLANQGATYNPESGTITYTDKRAIEYVRNNPELFPSAMFEIKKTNFNIDTAWLDNAYPKYECGKNGNDGTANSAPNCSLGEHGIGISEGYYNHIYTWTIPYMFNRLTYGEAGQAGEYKTTKIAKVDKPLQIKLGRGGVWKTPAPSETPDWEKGTKGPDGTDTIIKMGDSFDDSKTILTAKGGKGGSQKQMTDNYDLCYPANGTTNPNVDVNEVSVEEGICRNSSGYTNCCQSEKGTRSTRDIISTALNLSAFENIKSLVGNSLIIGTGTGRGGEGAGTRAKVEEVSGERKFMNSSAANGNRQVLSDTRPIGVTYSLTDDYNNTAINPSEHNFRGGDGAVIITW